MLLFAFLNSAAFIIPCLVAASSYSYNFTNISDSVANDNNSSFNFNCSNVLLHQGDYDLWTNGSVYIKKYELSLNTSFYLLLENNSLTICEPQGDRKLTPGVPYVSAIIFCTGLAALLIQLCVYWCVHDVNVLAFYNCAAVGCCVLLITLFLVVLPFVVVSSDISYIWYIIPAYTHFFMLVSFTWLSVLSTEFCLTFPIFTSQPLQEQYKKCPKSDLEPAVYVCNFWGLNVWAGFLTLFYLYNCIINFKIICTQYVDPEKNDCSIITEELSTIAYGEQFVLFCVLNVFGCAVDYWYRDHPKYPYSGIASRNFENARYMLRNHHMLFIEISGVLYLTWIVGSVGTIFSIRWTYFAFAFIHVVQVFCFIYSKQYFYVVPSKGYKSRYLLIYSVNEGKVEKGIIESKGIPFAQS